MRADLSYFRRRASEERTAAFQAGDPRVRKVHIDMAERYERRVRGLAAVVSTPSFPPLREHDLASQST